MRESLLIGEFIFQERHGILCNMSGQKSVRRSLLAKKEQENKYCVDGYNIDLDNKNDSHAIIVNAAKDAKCVLDVGCGVGYIGENLKKLGIKAVEGIELDEKARMAAKKVYDEVYGFSLNCDRQSTEYAKFLENKKKYDLIIFADILEHLTEPGQVLADFSKKLTNSGRIIISIPNIGNMSVIAELLDQEFNYTKTGIMDSTHLRFWTENSFYDFLDNINEAFNLRLQGKLIAQTFARNEEIDDAIFAKILGTKIYVFQNIFEVRQVDNPRQPKKKTHGLAKLTKYISDLEKENLEKSRKIQDYESLIVNIYESKSWKITAPLRNIRQKGRKDNREKS